MGFLNRIIPTLAYIIPNSRIKYIREHTFLKLLTRLLSFALHVLSELTAGVSDSLYEEAKTLHRLLSLFLSPPIQSV